MEVKKKNFLENLRLKTKLGNLKKPRKKALKEQGRNLAHRRSISVPNLNLLPGGAFPESTFETSEAIYFGISPGLSDSDSIASSSNNDGPLFSDKLQDSISESGLKVPTYLTDAALSRYSAPDGSLMLGEEMKDELINSGSENKMIKEGLYTQVDKKLKADLPKFIFEPIPAPRTVLTNALVSSRSDLERKRLHSEDAPAGLSDSVLVRAGSLREHLDHTQKKTISYVQKKPSSEKGTPPAIKKVPADRTSLLIDLLATPFESADGTSLESICGTPSEEQVNMPWTTDSEDLDRELCSPLFMRDFSVDEAVLEGTQSEDALEETTEVSFITVVFNHMSIICFT